MAAKLLVAMVAIGAWTRVESAASDPFPCLVALPSTLTVQQRHSVNVLIKDVENVVADDQARVQITFRRASDAGNACNESSDIAGQPASCLAVKTKPVVRGTPTAAAVKVLSSRVPECFPGERIPIIATVNCRLGAMSTVSNHNLTLKCRQARVLLQLDKPVYSAGQRVFVRGYFVDNFLRTLTQKVTLEIRNPSGVLMVLKTVNNDASIADGVIEDDFNLDSEPQFGFWTVTVKPFVMEGYPTLLLPSSTTFEVKDYVLPRFSVEVGLPPSISQLDDSGIAVEVAASYPFNAAVHGLASIKAACVWGNVRKELSLNYTAESLVITSLNRKMFGVARFTIPSSALWAALGYEALPFGSCLHVEAGVRDQTSLRRVKGMSSTCFVKHRCRVNASTLDTLLKPGLPYSSQVQLLDHLGHPAASQAAIVEIVQTSSDSSQASQLFNVTSDSFGVVHFFLPGGINMATRSASVKISTECSPPFQKGLLQCPTNPTCPGHIRVTSATSRRAEVRRNHLVRVRVSQVAEESIEIILMAVRDGDVLHSSRHELLASRHDLEDLFVYIQPKWAPGFHWVVYHVCTGGAMISDSLYQPVVFYQENNPWFHFQRNNTLFISGRAQRQTLQVSAKQGTTMYMLTVDQSVYFMNSTNRLTRDSLKKFVKPDHSNICRHKPSCHSSYAFQLAGITGLGATMATEGRHNPYCQARQGEMDIEDCCQRGRLVATRYGALICRSRAASYRRTQGAKCADVFTTCCANYHKPLKSLVAGNHRASGGHSGDQFNLDTLYERHHFPETIIGTIVMDSAVKLVDFHIPDTITGWTMQGVAVHPDYPLAVASELNFIVHKEFFLEMHLPSFLVHKEQFALRITLHSRAVRPQMFSIYLVGSWQYCSVAGASGRSDNASVSVPARSSVSLTYIITPLATGDIEISAQAISQGKFAGGSDSDFLTRTIFVKPRGVRLTTQCDSFAIVLSRGAAFQKDFQLILPGDEVPSTSAARIILSGNVLGHLSRLDGLDDMLEMPYGCGEQNMLRFSVNTIVVRYLSQTCGQHSRGPTLDPLLRRKALKYTREGYQRQMNYRRDDGSFSAFGNKDRSGSTWLTAFVAKSFCAVEPVMRGEIPIDGAVIARAIEWLESRRTFAGAFIEPGEIIDECMKGGSAGYHSPDEVDSQLTAFVAIAMFECRHSYPLAVRIAEEAALYLTRHYSSLDRAYDVALASYALSLAGPGVVDLDVVRSKLQSFSSVIDGATCDVSSQRYPAKHGRGCTGVYLETSAYAMLAQLRLGNAVECGQCYVDWFLKWRKDAGGFVSSQDTVMVIQALAEYQCCHVDENLAQNLSVSFSSHALQSSKAHPEHLQVNQDNIDLQQRVQVVSNFKKGVSVHVNASGEGRATVQYCLQYNAEHDEASCNFTISTRLKPNSRCSDTNATSHDPESCEMQMDVTVSLSAESTVNRTGMVIIEITLISGFTVDVKDLQRIVKEGDVVKRAERKGQTVLIYLDRLIIARAVTVTLRLYRTALLGLIQPAVIKVYDYYNPGISCHKFYHLPARNPMLSVLCKDLACLCGAGDCMQCPRTGSYSVYRGVRHMASLACSNDYAWRIRVLKVGTFENGWVRVKAQVEARLKRGRRDVNPGDKVSLYRPSHCACPDLEKGSSYLVTGPDRGLKLLLDRHTQIEEWSSTARFCKFQRLLENKPGVCDDVDQGWSEFKQEKDYRDCDSQRN